jgi:F-type H+-transporting ATPase subunit beta
MVTVNYLIHTLATRHAGHTVWLGLEHARFTREGLELAERGAGLSDAITFVFAQQEEPASFIPAAQFAVATAGQLAGRGRDVLLLVASPVALSDGARAALEAATHDTAKGSVTLLYYGEHSVGAEPEAFAGLDAAVAFDRWRATRGLFPAVDVLNSRSTLLEAQAVGERHARLARQVRRLLRRHQDLAAIPEQGPRGMDGLPIPDDAILLKRAQLMHEFLTQAMPEVELYTHRPGEYVPLAQTLDGCEAILTESR